MTTRRQFMKQVGRAGLWVPVAAALVMPKRAQAEVTYLGQNVTTGGSLVSPYIGYNAIAGSNNVLTCPGSGQQSVKSLGAYVQTSYDSAGPELRLSIYKADGTFVMQGSAPLSCVQHDSPAWFSHTAFVDAAGDPIASPELTGGEDYLLGHSTNNWPSNTIYIYGIAETGGAGLKEYTSYNSGWPSPLGSGWSTLNYTLSIRCGVEPAASPAGPRRRVQITL
jgi:hypothetical protein